MPKASELRNLGDADLVRRLDEAKEELFNLRFQHVTGQLDAPSRLGQVRKDIARLNTLLRQREIELAEDQARAAQSGDQARAAQSGDQARAAQSGDTDNG